jgi:adenosylhomocysteine nucleosidase
MPPSPCNTSSTLQYILNHFPVEGILFTGICGGISDRNQIGDIVIPDQWVTHDYGYVGPEGFRADSIYIGQARSPGFKNTLMMPVDQRLHDRVCRAAYAAAVDLKPVVDRIVQIRCGGVGATGNQLIDQVEKRNWLAEEFDAEIVDMESAAVLQAALANGVPCVIIRSASDLAGGSGSATATVEIREFLQIAADNSAAVVTRFFRMLFERKFDMPEG